MENEIKCITFDKEAQDAIPEHVKLKMQADKDAEIMKALLQKIEVNNGATIQSLTWLSEQKNHGLQDCTEVVRFLLKKVSELEGYKAAQSKPAEIIPFKEGYDKAEKFFSNRLIHFQQGYSVVDIVNRMKERYDLIPK